MILCTANRCRSPMAQALLARKLRALRIATPVWSAGMVRAGDPPLPPVIDVMASYGIDLASHRSRVVTVADLADAALIIGMAREHVRHAVVLSPDCWPRAFTLKELVRRGDRVGPRQLGETVRQWLSRAHGDRDRAALLGSALEDDVPDPLGGPPEAYAETAALLDRLIEQLVDLCWRHARPDRSRL